MFALSTREKIHATYKHTSAAMPTPTPVVGYAIFVVCVLPPPVHRSVSYLAQRLCLLYCAVYVLTRIVRSQNPSTRYEDAYANWTRQKLRFISSHISAVGL